MGLKARPYPPVPPVAERVPTRQRLHGDVRQDDYAWLRNKNDPRVRAYLSAENAYAAAIMGPTEALRTRLYDEMLGRIVQTDSTVPYPDGDYLYYSRTEEGKQYSIHCRRRDEPEAAERVILDVNELARGQAFMALGALEVSDDGRLLAYTTDNSGFREYTLRVRDLDTGAELPLAVDRVGSVAWATGTTLFYTRDHERTKRPYQVYRHHLGSELHELIYDEPDERFRVYVFRSRSRAVVFLGVHSHTTSEGYFAPADRPEEAFVQIAAREHEHEYYADHGGDWLYIRTNDRGRNFRVVRAPIAAPGRESWQELIPHRDDVMIEALSVFAGHYVVREREAGLPQLRVVDLATGTSHRIAVNEPVYEVRGAANAEFDTHEYRFEYESLTTPTTTYAYDVRSRDRRMLKRQPVLGGYEPERYLSERVFAIAADGVRVPVSIVRGRDAPRDGTSPMLLVGYGSYGGAYPVAFSSTRLSLLERGVGFAIAHVRGGGEIGTPWHDQGRMLAKRNTFGDFIAVAAHLIDNGYTSPDRLIISGGSAGGLLMGVVANERPELFRAIVSHVPFVDVINTMLDDSLPLTVGEYEEWGNPKIPAHYQYMKSYCPYSNLAAHVYPAMLVKTSLNDSQVMYWEPAKYVARLRALKTDDHVVLLHTNMRGGHGGSSGRYDRLRELAFDYAFMLMQLGLA